MGWRPGFEEAVPVFVREGNGWMPEGEYLGSPDVSRDGKSYAVFIDGDKQNGWWILSKYVTVLDLTPCLGGE